MKSITEYYAFLEPHEYEHAGDEVGALLTVSPSRGSTVVDHALTLSERPRVLAALASGRLDLGKALLIASMVQPLDAAHHEAVEDDLLAFADTHHYSSLQQHARRVIHRIDPAAALRRHEEKKKTRRVEKLPQDDAMCDLRLCFTAVEAITVWDRLDRLARNLTGDDRTMNQRRADVAYDLLMGSNVVAPQGETRVQVTLPATTLMGMDEEPGMLTGYGPIPAPVAREMAAGGTWKRILTDPTTGIAVDVGRHNYRPSAAIADLVRARDVTCVGIGCRMPAERCDLDHCEPFNGHNTTPENLAPNCRRNHRMKHDTRWIRQQFPNGSHIWRSPLGRTYVRNPVPIAEPAPTVSDEEAPPF